MFSVALAKWVYVFSYLYSLKYKMLFKQLSSFACFYIFQWHFSLINVTLRVVFIRGKYHERWKQHGKQRLTRVNGMRRYAPTWWPMSNLAARDAVAGVKFSNAVKPTLRKSSTSSRNWCGICPVQSLFLFLDRAGSTVVASPVGNVQVLRKVSSWSRRSLCVYVALLYFERIAFSIVRRTYAIRKG